MIKNKKFMVLLSGFLVIGLFIFFFFVSTFFKSSYAISTGINRSLLPKQDFHPNYSSITNFIRNSLGDSSNYQNYLHNFDFPSNYRTEDNSHPLYSLMKNLSFSKDTEKIELLDDNPTSVSDQGLLYILAHGYNSTNSYHSIFSDLNYGYISDNSIKQYITQIALWLYLYEHQTTLSSYCIDTGNSIHACDFYDSSNQNNIDSSTVREIISSAASKEGYSYLNYILSLVDQANLYQGEEASSLMPLQVDPSYTIDEEKKYIITSEIVPSVSSNQSNFMFYSIELNDPNHYGAYLVRSNLEKITDTTHFTGSFRIYIPISSDIREMDLSSITVNVFGHFTKLEGYQYRVTSSSVTSEGSNNNLMNNYGGNKYQKYANLLLGYVPYEIVNTSFRLSNFVKISKIDIANSKELPGATLVITNRQDDTKTWKFESGDKPHYLYLPNGDYTLCETIAPKGYALSEECIPFTVDGSSIRSVVMKDEVIQIPNTLSRASIYFSIIGICLILIGCLILFMIYRRYHQY